MKVLTRIVKVYIVKEFHATVLVITSQRENDYLTIQSVIPKLSNSLPTSLHF